jgi:hypothetical protein
LLYNAENVGHAFVTPDEATFHQFLQAWSKLLRLFDLHRLNQTPTIAANHQFRVGLEDADFIQKQRVTLSGRTEHNVLQVLQECHAQNSVVFEQADDYQQFLGVTARSSVRQCEVGPAAYFCELHFKTRSDAMAALALFENHPHVNNLDNALRCAKVSISVKSDTGGLLIRPISVVEALASACKLEIESNVYSSAFARLLQPKLMNPVVTVEQMSGWIRELLSNPDNACSQAVFHIRSLFEAAAPVANRRHEIMKLNTFFQNVIALSSRREPLNEYVMLRVLQPLHEGVEALSVALTNSVSDHPGSFPALCKVVLEFYVLPSVAAVRNIPQLSAALRDVSDVAQHLAQVTCKAPRLLEIFSSGGGNVGADAGGAAARSKDERKDDVARSQGLIRQFKIEHGIGEQDVMGYVFASASDGRDGKFKDLFHSQRIVQEAAVLEFSDMKVYQYLRKSRNFAALSAAVLARVTTQPSLSNIRALKTRGGVSSVLDIVETLSQNVIDSLGATDEGIQAAAVATTCGVVAGTEPVPGGGGARGGGEVGNVTAAAVERDFIQSILQPVQSLRNLVIYGRHVIALLSRPFYPAAVAFGSVSSLTLPMTLLALFRGPTALDLNYSFALGAAGFAASITHDIFSGIRSNLNSENSVVYFRALRSCSATAASATVGFFVGKFLRKVRVLYCASFKLIYRPLPLFSELVFASTAF